MTKHYTIHILAAGNASSNPAAWEGIECGNFATRRAALRMIRKIFKRDLAARAALYEYNPRYAAYVHAGEWHYTDEIKGV